MKFPLFFLLLFALSSLHAHTVVEDRSELKIVTPSLAKRETLKLRLDNGLEAYLISDPDVSESGAALAVEAGSFCDPEETAGMAHFVEHMLFMGTAKYPGENDYHAFLSTHGGNHNAFTANDRTVYMFSIKHDSFQEALSRFSDFFIAPLLRGTCVKRECAAIDQEFRKDLSYDSWRALFVKKELGNLSHPFHSFCIGSTETLSSLPPEKMRAWMESHYSSHLMHLVILSKEPLDSLVKLVSTHFSDVKKIDAPSPIFVGPLLGEKAKGALIVLPSVQGKRELEMCFELPDSLLNDEEQVGRLACYVLGHEGEKSLLALLKKEGLAEGLSSSCTKLGEKNAFLTLTFDLTKKGLTQRETIIGHCFQAISSLKASGIPRYLFDEMVKMAMIDYNFQQREETFSLMADLAYALSQESLDTFPRRTLAPMTYSKENLQVLFAALTPQNCCFTLIVPPHEKGFTFTNEERWMKTPYTVTPFSPSLLAKWAKVSKSDAFALPQPNRYIPQALSAQESGKTHKAESLPVCQLLVNEPLGKLYLACDDRFFVPKVAWHFTLRTPLIANDNSPSTVLADLFCLHLQNKLSSLGYEAALAGLFYHATPAANGINLTIEGYSEQAAPFLLSILKEMTHITASAEEFARAKEEKENDYTAAEGRSPTAQTDELLRSVLYKDYTTLATKKELLAKITHEQFCAFSSRLFEESFTQATLLGPQGKEAALSLWQEIRGVMGKKGYAQERHFHDAIALLPQDQPRFLTKKGKHSANVVMLTVVGESFCAKERALMDILSTSLEEPFFSELRTEQQTAYLVRNWVEDLERHLHLFFLVQSSSHDPRDLLSRFELFFETFLQHLPLSEERFATIKSSLIATLQAPAENLEKMGKLLHRLAFEYDGNFSYLNERISALEALTYDQFRQGAHRLLGRTNRKRLAVFLTGALPQEEAFSYKRLSSPKKLREEITYSSKEGALSIDILRNYNSLPLPVPLPLPD